MINLFCCCKNVFTHMNTRIIEKSSMKNHYLRKSDFYSHLNLEDITVADYTHAKRVFSYFEIKKLGEYQDLYFQSGTLLLAVVLNNFRKISLEIYGLHHAHLLSATGLAWQAAFKMTKVKLGLLTDIDVLLMIEKGISGRICHAIHQYVKASNKYMNNYYNNRESFYLNY